MTESLDSLAYSKAKVAKTLIRMAWAIEIIAAIVGLSLGIALTADQLAISDQRITQLIPTFLPFFAVALVELVKIPLASVLYLTDSFKWKIILSFGLFAALIITFETFIAGFEITSTIRTKALTTLHAKIAEKESIILNFTDKQTISTNEDDRLNVAQASHSERIKSISSDYQGRRSEIKNQIEAINLEYSKQNSESALADELKSRRTNLIKERDEAIKSENKARQIELESAEKEGEQASTAINNQISALQQDKNAIRASTDNQLESCIFSCSAIRADRDKKLQAINEKINELLKSTTASGRMTQINSSRNTKINQISNEYKERIDDLSKKIATHSSNAAGLVGKKKPEDIIRLQELRSQLSKLSVEEGQQKKIATDDYNDQATNNTLVRKTARVALEDKVQAERDKELLCNEFDDKVVSNQIYRIALRINYADNAQRACELSQDKINLVSAVWFGSIAFIVAFLGTLLAFGSFLMTNPPKTSDPSKSIGRLLRGLVFSVRRRLKNPKIIKEIVEKEVQVEVERIKEIIVPEVRYVKEEVKIPVVEKEYVHIPVYTNDPTLVEWDASSKVKPKK